MAEFKGTYTEHYNFAKPSPEDNVDIGVINENMNKLDGILQNLKESIDSNVYVNTEDNTVNYCLVTLPCGNTTRHYFV